MITVEMLTAAVYSFMGLAALVVVLTQIFKNGFGKAEWYKKAKEAGKKWPDHMFAFISSFICNAAVLGIGLYFGIGVFTAFCLTCLSSWLLFIGSFICCGFVANGEWSYEFMQKILEWIKLLPKQTKKSVAHEYEKTAQKILDEAMANVEN
jgi:hypothetical protein